jgi:3-dehydroquinate dehydratase type I
VIVSHHDFEATPDDDTLRGLVADMFKCGGDIAKIAATATDISDSARMLRLLNDQQGVSFCTLAGSERFGLIARCEASARWQRDDSLLAGCSSLRT